MARRRAQSQGPSYLSTFQVAKLLGVSPPTVVNWVNAGLLTAHRTVGGHRRMTAEDVVAFARAHSYPLPSELVVDRAPRRVLIVDDEPEFCDFVREYLVRRASYEVAFAHSGFEAGLAVGRFKPGVVLMDLMMPDMDGFEVLRVLQGDPETRRIPVVACTAYRDPAIDERVRREPFVDYVQKPVRLDALLSLFEQVLEGKVAAKATAS